MVKCPRGMVRVAVMVCRGVMVKCPRGMVRVAVMVCSGRCSYVHNHSHT